VEAGRAAGVRHLLLASTRAIAESGGAYSRSKRAAEAAVVSGGIPFTIVRLPELVGGRGEGAARIVDAAVRGRAIPIVGRGDYEMCPMLVDDVVDTLMRVFRSPNAFAGRTFTLGGECTRIREFAEQVVAACGSESRIVPVPVRLVRALSPLSRVLPLPLYPDQLARLRAPKSRPAAAEREELGFEPPPLTRTIAVAVERARGGVPD
jgi:NADH dehydrogenase